MNFKECRYEHHTGQNPVAVEDMIRDKSRKDGFAEICKPCAYIRKKKYLERVYAGDPTLQAVTTFRQAQTDRNKRRKVRKGIEHVLFNSVKARAARKGLDFDLSIEDIVIPIKCPILDIELMTDVFIIDGVKRNSPFPDNYPSVDRIDSDKGYTKNNCHVISWKANRLKSNATVDDIKKLYEWCKTFGIES